MSKRLDLLNITVGGREKMNDLEFGKTLEDKFLSAPFEDNGWYCALETLAAETGSSRAQLLAIGGPTELSFNCVTDMPSPTWEQEFLEIDGCNPRVNWRIASSSAPLVVVGEESYAQNRALLRSTLYDDFASHYDMMNGCQTVLHSEAESLFGLATLRTRADGPTSEANRAVFARAAPAALSAIRLQYALEQEAAKLAAGALDAMKAIAFIGDAHGRIRACTGAAERYLEASGGLRLRRDNLLAVQREAHARLQRGIAAAIAPDGSGRVAAFWMVDPHDTRRGQLCEIFALPRKPWSFGRDPRFIVIVRGSGQHGANERRLLRELLGLTAAEAEVAMAMAEGTSRERIANARGTSLGTVNAQLKSIFVKADVTREAELTALLNKLFR